MTAAAAVLLAAQMAAPAAADAPVLPEPVVWDSPSADARGSMPLGNGDLALNAWVDPSGDLLFYLAKSDAWEDNARLAKLGLVRVRLSPALVGEKTRYRQTLDPARGELVVEAARDGAATTRLRLWVDAHQPVVHVEVEADAPVTATASFELWRTSRETLPSIEASDVNLDRSRSDQQHQPTVVEPDTVLQRLAEGVGWLHHNAKSVGPVETMRHQDLLGAPWKDPVLGRTFGAVVRSPGAKPVSNRQLERAAATRHRFDVYALTKHPSTPVEWLGAMKEEIARVERIPFAQRRAAHLAWWRAFWSRSHVVVRAAAGARDPSAAADVTRGYALQRFVTACAGRGGFPIKFNGSLFTVPWPGKPGDADYRRWGPGFWWQNTRLPYVPLLASGDLDLLEPLYRMYVDDLLPVARYRTKRYFGFDGAAYLTEVTYSWGAVFAETYGRESAAAERSDKLQSSGWHKREWVAGLELAFMLLEHYEHTGDERLLREKVLPLSLPVVRFFDLYYRTGPDGRLRMHPAQALETWWETTNPMPEVAGLHAVVQRLLALPAGRLSEDDRVYLSALAGRIPPLPTRTEDGVRMLAPAERFADKRNIENPELYAVFPFRLVSFEKDDAALGIEALHRRLDRGAQGWRQEDVFMAYLGLADEARAYVVERARRKDPDSRFPAFWGPNYDWTPDQCHGGVLMKALQSMLLQHDGERVYLLPAWPRDWDADFKLHAPRSTVVEGSVRDGRVVRLEVTPASRRSDVVRP